MDKQVIEQVISNGAFAALFIWLLFYVLRENAKREQKLTEESAKREQKLHELLEKLTERYENLSINVCEIRDHIIKRAR